MEPSRVANSEDPDLLDRWGAEKEPGVAQESMRALLERKHSLLGSRAVVLRHLTVIRPPSFSLGTIVAGIKAEPIWLYPGKRKVGRLRSARNSAKNDRCQSRGLTICAVGFWTRMSVRKVRNGRCRGALESALSMCARFESSGGVVGKKSACRNRGMGG